MLSESNYALFPRHDVYQEIKLVGLCQRLCNVCTRQRSSFVRVCDNECTSCYFCDENCAFDKSMDSHETECSALSQALQNNMGASAAIICTCTSAGRAERYNQRRHALTSGSLFITFLILARGRGGCL